MQRGAAIERVVHFSVVESNPQHTGHQRREYKSPYDWCQLVFHQEAQGIGFEWDERESCARLLTI